METKREVKQTSDGPVEVVTNETSPALVLTGTERVLTDHCGGSMPKAGDVFVLRCIATKPVQAVSGQPQEFFSAFVLEKVNARPLDPQTQH